MSHTDLSRRTFLRAGSGLIAAAALGGCTSSPASRSTSDPATTPTSAPGTTAREVPTSTVEAIPAPAGATRFRAVRPVRLADTRQSDGWTRVGADRTRVPVAGHAGVPAGAAAVAVRVRGISGAGNATVTVVPAADGVDPAPIGIAPASSAMCFVLLGSGAVDVLHSTDTDAVTVDVVGYFEPTGSATSGGRVVTIDPARIVDTRVAARPFAPSETRRFTPDGVCPPDAYAVLVQVTASSDTADATWTVHPSGGQDHPPTLTSEPGQRTTASTVVPLADGGFDATSEAGGHLSIDVVGYVTGDDAPVSTDGLYVPTTPTRLLDTRMQRQPVPDGSSREFELGTDQCGAVAVNVTTVATTAQPAINVWGAGRPPALDTPVAVGSAGTAMSHQSVTRAGRRGIAIGSVGGDTHVVADLYGWFTGTRSAELEPVLGSQPYGIEAVDMESRADEWLDYGMSSDNRPLRAFRHGTGPRVGLITTGLHGDEHTGTSVLADLVTRDAIPGWTLWLVPIANPDARAANLRFVHDVDMNRDFPVDWSEIPRPTGSGCVTTRTGPVPHSLVESQRLASAMIDGPFRGASISISHHDNYNWVAPQSGSPAVLRELADAYADATGLRRPGEGGSSVPTSPRSTHVDGGFETFADSLGMSSFLVENKAGYVGGSWCAGDVRPAAGSRRRCAAPRRAALAARRRPAPAVVVPGAAGCCGCQRSASYRYSTGGTSPRRSSSSIGDGQGSARTVRRSHGAGQGRPSIAASVREMRSAIPNAPVRVKCTPSLVSQCVAFCVYPHQSSSMSSG